MGALVVAVAVIFFLARAATRGGSRFRWLAPIPALLTVVGLVGAVGSFVGAATGDTGDMDPSGAVLLGLVFLAAAVGLGLLTWRLAVRR